jgi:hypothetical protein
MTTVYITQNHILSSVRLCIPPACWSFVRSLARPATQLGRRVRGSLAEGGDQRLSGRTDSCAVSKWHRERDGEWRLSHRVCALVVSCARCRPSGLRALPLRSPAGAGCWTRLDGRAGSDWEERRAEPQRNQPHRWNGPHRSQ